MENKKEENKITEVEHLQSLIKIRVFINILRYLFFDFAEKNTKKFENVNKIPWNLKQASNLANSVISVWGDDKLDLKEAQCAVNSVFYHKIPIEGWDSTTPEIKIEKKDCNAFFKNLQLYTKAGKAEMEFLGISSAENEVNYDDFLTKKKKKKK